MRTGPQAAGDLERRYGFTLFVAATVQAGHVRSPTTVQPFSWTGSGGH
jgi:hypothetical protein